ncbi:S-layer homology domain-containing protein [Paenibacillus sp. GCM10023252]|uniref:S-layer homology domain-containing protein n=1 Tax=Paenibacillus sp. GCM10023252 TaxID=3252649 RepID=UPI0036096B3E
MTRLWKQTLSLLVALALLVTIAPIAPVKAAGSYFTFTDFSPEVNNPTIVNNNTVNLGGSFSDVSPNSITFRIERLVNGAVVESSNGSNNPLINGNTFLFAGVQLYEGLNKITVLGTSVNGNIVEGACYVSFGNVPVITEVKLASGVPLVDGKSEIVTTANPSILVKANNATEVVINGRVMFNGGAGTFVMSDLNLRPGLNRLEIVSRNGNKSYTLIRQLTYFGSTPTAINVSTVATPTTILDGKPTVAPFDAAISGKVVFAIPTTTVPTAPDFTLELFRDGVSVQSAIPATSGALVVNSGWHEFSFVTDINVDALKNGNYTLWIRSDSYGTSANFPLEFTVRNASGAYIRDIRQVYGVITSGSDVSYTSSTTFSNNNTVSQLPLYLAIDAANFTTGTSSITAKVNGVAAPAGSFEATLLKNGTQHVYRIDAMPQGEVELSFSVTQGSNTDTVTRVIRYSPISAIQITNTYDGDIFYDGTPFKKVAGKLINFNLNSQADKDSLTIMLNGVTTKLDTFNSDGSFDEDLPGDLVYGPNELIISGNANGVAVSTRITIYQFSSRQPIIAQVKPVPYKVHPKYDGNNERYFTDIDQKFKYVSLNNYTTTEEYVDILFNVRNALNLVVKVDGQDYATASVAVGAPNDGKMSIPGADDFKLYLENEDVVEKSYELRLFNLAMPTSGAKSITISAQIGSENVSQTITITREFVPYELLSPKLPQQKVINQNFLPVSIKAQGADRVVIGKAEMVLERPDDYIFRYELKNLKAGVNKVKFTVYRGEESLNGEFSVNYAADNSIGAQYKASVTAGKVSAFKGELALTFPKNTFLRPANEFPGQDVDTIDLFDSQQILFGIADRTDGRTVKVYNAVGEYDNQQPKPQALDGTFKNIGYSEFGASVLRPTTHFGFASNLFWIDPGAVQGTMQTGYNFVEGQQPYAPGNEFHSRALSKWLEPSNQGKITIKYDPAIRDVNAKLLSVWRYYAGQWSNVGGIVNTGQKTVTAPLDGFGYYVVSTLRYSYNDIVGHEYARNSIELMYARGVMNPKGNNEFGVYDNITRGEFAQLLVKAFQIPLEYDPNNMTFDDVIPLIGLSPFWDYRYIETAVRKGIVRGKGPRVFLPNEPLTREEGAVMIARAANLVKNGAENQTKDRATLQKLFTDANIIDVYALASVIAVNKAKYIEGLPNTTTGTAKKSFRFDPKSNLKRADAAIIAERVMRKLKLI